MTIPTAPTTAATTTTRTRTRTMLLPPPSSTSVETFGSGTIRICRSGRGGGRNNKNNILIVALSREEVKNAFSDSLYEDLTSLLHCTSKEESISAIVLTGSGSYFSSGADLKGTNLFSEDNDNNNDNNNNASSRDSKNKPVGQFMHAIIHYPKVIAAAVNGPAVGIGVTLLMHCDLCYCSDVATFWTPFSRIALVPELSSSATFVDAMGLSNANELLLLGKKINAEEAVRRNICSKIIYNCNLEDPFHSKSIANYVCNEIQEQLLSLPLGEKTSMLFVSMIKGRRREYMEKVCNDEFIKMDERIDGGDVLEAVMQLDFGAKKKSKL